MAMTKQQKQQKIQAACPHPSAHVHPAIDPRYETCDLCHIIAPAPINPPWFVAYDAEQPAPPPLQLFADYSGASGETGEEVTPAPRSKAARARRR